MQTLRKLVLQWQAGRTTEPSVADRAQSPGAAGQPVEAPDDRKPENTTHGTYSRQ